MRTIASLFALLAALSVVVAAGAPGATAAERPAIVTQELAFAGVRAVILRNLAGRLSIRPHAAAGVRVRLEGPGPLVAALRAEVVDGALHLIGPAVGQGRRVVQIDGGVVVAGGGGTAMVSIGSVTRRLTSRSDSTVQRSLGGGRRETASERPLDVVVELPESLPITVDGLIGSAEVGRMKAPVRLVLHSGTARLGEVRDASLTVAGGGSIIVGKAVGTLAVEISGAGAVRVRDGRMTDLGVRIDGAGEAVIGGRAARATLTVGGVARLHVNEVAERPEIDVSGLGQVTIGNW